MDSPPIDKFLSTEIMEFLIGVPKDLVIET